MLFLIAILLGIGMRFYGLKWGLPYHFHSDEHLVASFTEKLRTAESITQLLHPDRLFFLYSPFLMYLLIALVTVASFFHSFSHTDAGSLTLYFLLGRCLVVCFSSLTLIMVYQLGKRLFTKSIGMLAAVFLAFTVLHIRDSHFYLPDVPMTFFVVLTVFFAAGIMEGKGIKSYILTGVFAGVGIATKQTALMVFPVILAAHIIGTFKNQQVPSNSIKKVILSYQFWGLLLAPFLIAGITFLLLDPFVLINPQKFLEVSHQTAMFVKGIRQHNWTFQFTGTKISYWFTNLLYFGMGPLLELVSLIGVLWAIVNGVLRVAGHRIKNICSADLLMLSFLLPYLYFIGGGYMKFIRYSIPLLPFLCLLGARFMLDIYEMTTHKNVRIAVGALITVVIITSFLYALAYLNIYRQEDVRIQASKWIHQHIPPESTILVDSSSATPLLGSMFFQPQLYDSYYSGFGLRSLYKKDYFRIKVLLLLTEIHHSSRSRQWWERYLKGRLQNVDYIIMSDEYYEQYSHRSSDYPTLNQFYQDLFTGNLGFQQIKTYKTHPSLFGYALNDDRAELTFRLFDHPKIMIFKRNRP
jgi:4-amino-4-deoxy-L-arabinose transferase-like glycosyltransferase